MNRKVLVLGVDDRSGLAIVRSLGREGIKVHIGGCPENSVVQFSRYTTKIHKLPEYLADDWLDALIDLLEQEKFDLVIPTDESSTLPLIKKRSVLEKIVKLAIPSDQAFYCTYRKTETGKLAHQLGVPVPRQAYILGENDFSKIDSGWRYPLVIKPVSSQVEIRNQMIALRVRYADSREQLLGILQEMLQITSAIVQEYFVGTGMGVELLADKGKILCAFQHVRIHEPIHGGGSTYRKSVPLNPKLLRCAESLISALGWTGVAMVEFKYNESTNEFVLIEINGRFWGSLPLSIVSGMNFPYYLYQLLVENKKEYSGRYRTGVYCRNLSLDLGWFKHNLFTKPSKFNNALPFRRLIREPLSILLFREHYDTFALDDLRPGFKELCFIFAGVKEKLASIFLKYWLKLSQGKISQKKRVETIIRKRPVNICFICKGNICRSPFAELYLKKILADKSCSVKVSSSGYYPQELRCCPFEAVRAAMNFDINLDRHRSSVLSEKIILQNDMIFVFDIEEWLALRKKFRSIKSKVFFLGCLADNSQIQFIPDPYGGNEEVFQKTYFSLSSLLENLGSLLIHGVKEN